MSYPDRTNPDFNKKLISKREFYENRLNSNAPIFENPTGNSLEPHQKFLRNYMSINTQYDSLLIFHEMGVGKTCAAISICETFKGKKFILVKNDSIATNFKNELKSKFCTGDKYINDAERDEWRSLRGKNEKKNFNAMLSSRIRNEGYSFMTYSMLVSNAKKMNLKDPAVTIPKKSELNLNDTLIVVDECHNLFGNDAYTTLRRILDRSYNYKIVLLSATPVFDNLTELPELLNLLDKSNHLPVRKTLLSSQPNFLEKKLPFGSSRNTSKTSVQEDAVFSLTDYGKEMTLKAIHGRISYLKSNPSSFPKRIEMGKPISPNKGSIVVVDCPMSDYQFSVYLKAEERDRNPPKDEKRSVALKHSSDAATIAYPGEVYGKRGFQAVIRSGSDKGPTTTKKSGGGAGLAAKLGLGTSIKASSGEVVQIKKGKNARNLYLKDEFKDIFSGSNLKNFSSKIFKIVENIKNNKGTCFVYSQFVTDAGISAVAAALVANGFEEYTGSTFERENRFAILDGNTDVKEREVIRQLFSSPENKDGKIIKVIMGTAVISEGITFKNVRNVHLLEPSWNMSRMEQIIGRAVRNKSHDDLPPSERKVQIFKYMSTRPQGRYTDLNAMPTVDEKKYAIAEQKDRNIKEVEYLFKTNAFDCALNRSRNILPSSQDFEKICNYRECDYICEGFPDLKGSDNKTLKEEEIDDSTYIYSFSRDEIDQTKEIIKNLYQTSTSHTVKSLYRILKYNKILISKALDEMVGSRKIFKNENEDSGFLIYRSGYYIFNPVEVPLESPFFNKKYPSYYRKPKKKISTRPAIYDFLVSKGLKFKKDPFEQQSKGASEKEKGKGKVSSIGSGSGKRIDLSSKELYGTTFNKSGKNDGKFRIVDNRNNKNTSSGDKRKLKAGSVCESSGFKKGDLLNILSYLGVKEDYSDLKKSEICMVIKDTLEKKGLVEK